MNKIKGKLMKTKLYPAIFEKNDDGFLVTFPDLRGCITGGNDIYEAYEHAQEALGLYLDDEELLPEATKNLDKIKVAQNERVMLVAADTTKPIIYFDQDFFTQINKILENKNLTKYRLAKELNINESYINKVFNGKRKPSPNIAKKIGDYLGFDWELFF